MKTKAPKVKKQPKTPKEKKVKTKKGSFDTVATESPNKGVWHFSAGEKLFTWEEGRRGLNLFIEVGDGTEPCPLIHVDKFNNAVFFAQGFIGGTYFQKRMQANMIPKPETVPAPTDCTVPTPTPSQFSAAVQAHK